MRFINKLITGNVGRKPIQQYRLNAEELRMIDHGLNSSDYVIPNDEYHEEYGDLRGRKVSEIYCAIKDHFREDYYRMMSKPLPVEISEKSKEIWSAANKLIYFPIGDSLEKAFNSDGLIESMESHSPLMFDYRKFGGDNGVFKLNLINVAEEVVRKEPPIKEFILRNKLPGNPPSGQTGFGDRSGFPLSR
jgi:hypothetical protein